MTGTTAIKEALACVHGGIANRDAGPQAELVVAHGRIIFNIGVGSGARTWDRLMTQLL